MCLVTQEINDVSSLSPYVRLLRVAPTKHANASSVLSERQLLATTIRFIREHHPLRILFLRPQPEPVMPNLIYRRDNDPCKTRRSAGLSALVRRMPRNRAEAEYHLDRSPLPIVPAPRWRPIVPRSPLSSPADSPSPPKKRVALRSARRPDSCSK